MITHVRVRAAAAPLLVVCLLAAPCASAAASKVESPLPASDYSARAACGDASARHARCLSLKLVPETAAARAHTHPLGRSRAARPAAEPPSPADGSFGLRPADLHSAYELPSDPPAPQTVAIVDAYNALTAETDLTAYSETFGLPPCTSASGCFTKVNQKGETANLPFPKSKSELEKAPKAKREEAEGWALEISLDVQAVHAVCSGCKVLLVEAKSSSYADLEQAEETAVALGADEISNSWGGPECFETTGGPECVTEPEATAFDHPGTVITASAGDDGYLSWSGESGFAEFPASSPDVVSVGGTRLSLGEGGWAGETVWNGNGAGGGGCSLAFAAPAWQLGLANWSAVGCAGGRAVADVSAVADPYTGLAVHDSGPICEELGLHWCTIGGTSLSSPIIAAVFALAGGADGVGYPAQTLYERAVAAPAALHDVVNGSNGECNKPFTSEGLSGCTTGQEAANCAGHAICLAGSGFDGPTGVGTPRGIAAFAPAAGAGGSGTKGSGGGTGPGTGQGSGAASVGTSPPAAAAANGQPGASQPAITARLYGLALTRGARAALRRSRPRPARIRFGYRLSAAAPVIVELAKLTPVPGDRTHRAWRRVKRPFTINAVRGHQVGRLRGAIALSAGRYRLTLTPRGGKGASARFSVG